MNTVTLYSTNTCPYCTAAKTLLSKSGLSYTEHNVARDQEKYQEMLNLSKQRTVPQIVIDDQHIGGYTDLLRYLKHVNLKSA